MTKQFVQFNKRSLAKFHAFFKEGEQNFVMAKTLTQVASLARRMLRKESASKWTIRNAGALRGYGVRPATKRDIESIVGHRDWYAIDQLASGPNIRSPEKSKWLYVPLRGTRKGNRGKLTPYAPKRAVTLANKKRGRRIRRKKGLKAKPFFIDTPSGLVIAIREGSQRKPLSLLYKLVPRQRIVPKVSMNAVAAKASAKGQKLFNKNMRQAMRPLR